MDRRLSTDGFLLAEMCIAILAFSTMALMFLPMIETHEDTARTYPYDYLLSQSEAMAKADHIVFEQEGYTVAFNENGNIQQAQTMVLGRLNKTVISELGGGRLVFR